VNKSALTVVALLATACGYHVAGRADLVPKTIQTIAIPAFSNITTRYKLTDRLPEAISREFISRTRYRIVSDPDQADAVLRGAVLSYSSYPTIFDPATGRASGVQLQVTLRVSLVERASGKVLFNRPRIEVRERYQISTDPSVFFEESDGALDRASQQTARQVVSSILENF
jgi:outer membrane lipopolysaccharide assembly protein LptE/RlpB